MQSAIWYRKFLTLISGRFTHRITQNKLFRVVGFAQHTRYPLINFDELSLILSFPSDGPRTWSGYWRCVCVCVWKWVAAAWILFKKSHVPHISCANNVSTFCILTSQSGKWQIMRMMSASFDRHHFIISFEFNWCYCNVVKFGNDTSNLPICANRHLLTWYYLIVMMPMPLYYYYYYIYFFIFSFLRQHFFLSFRMSIIRATTADMVQSNAVNLFRSGASVAQFLSNGSQWEQYNQAHVNFNELLISACI